MRLYQILLCLLLVNTVSYATTIQTEKEVYFNNEIIKVNLTEMLGDKQDWVGIYPADDNNDWANVLTWKWTGGAVDINLSLGTLPEGDYEVRAFFKNKFHTEAFDTFRVNKALEGASISTTKANYTPNESIIVNYNHMSGDPKDWIAIYPKEKNNEWKNVIEWKWTEGKIEEKTIFNKLPEGEYEIRAFFRNSFTLESKSSFKVIDSPLTSTMYENAENGISNEWIHTSGNFPPSQTLQGGFNSQATVVLIPEWVSNVSNIAGYALPLHSNKKEKILELDMGGLPNYPIWHRNGILNGYVAHFSVGVRVTTTQGSRRMIWDSFFNHGNVEAFKTDYGNGNVWLSYPSPVEHVRGWGYGSLDQWDHFKVDIQAELQKLEPNNEIISVDTFIATGGLLDNIKLSSK